MGDKVLRNGAKSQRPASLLRGALGGLIVGMLHPGRREHGRHRFGDGHGKPEAARRQGKKEKRRTNVQRFLVTRPGIEPGLPP